jgi:hypothetical protein
MTIKTRVKKLESASGRGLRVIVPITEPQIFGPEAMETVEEVKVSWPDGEHLVSKRLGETFEDFRLRAETTIVAAAKSQFPNAVVLPPSAQFL